jgi:hypothetical protein
LVIQWQPINQIINLLPCLRLHSLDLLPVIKNESAKFYALLTICQSAIEDGNKTIASQIISRLPKLPLSSMRLLQIIAELGFVDQARELADKIEKKSSRDGIYAVGYETQAMASVEQSKEEAIKLWVTELKGQLIDKPAGSYGRALFYDMLTVGVPFINRVAQREKTLLKIHEAIVEIEGWWTLDTKGQTH